MKKSISLALLLVLTLAAAPASAQTGQPAPQQVQAPPQGTANPGCRMMGGSGMGMGPGMMGHGMMGGGMGMGPGMMGGGMSMQQMCMMGDCWRDGMMGRGMMTGGMMKDTPGPGMTIQTAFREVNGYRMSARALGLNENQLQRLNGIEEALMSAVIRGRADLQIAALDFRRTMAQDAPDLKKAEEIVNRKAESWKQIQKVAINAVAEARKVLTPEQRQKAKGMTAAPGRMMMPMAPGQSQQEPGDHAEHH
jgi:hypothetical protein